MSDTTKIQPATPRHIQGGYWFRVSSTFMQDYAPYLPPIALNVYVYLCYRANVDAVTWPSIKRMSRDLNLSASSIQRALRTLIQQGLVVKFNRPSPEGDYTSNLYVLCEVLPISSPHDPHDQPD